MQAKIALCVDELEARHPALIGLDDETLEAQEWLCVYSSGEEARRAISEERGIDEAWVVSCDDVKAINLAATIKADHPAMTVRLVDFDVEGSLLSRAHAARIDEVIDGTALARRYGEVKERYTAKLREAAAEPVLAGEAVMPKPTVAVLEGELELPEPEASLVETTQSFPSWQPGPAANRGKAFVFPIVSGSGGAGKSSVAAIAALAAKGRGCKTLLLDYDLQFGDVAPMVGAPDALAIDEAIARPDLLERELAKDQLLTVLAAPERIEVAEAVVRAMPQMLDHLMSAFDVIVANTGAAWAEQHAVLLERSSAALFLVDQRASSMRACSHALELCARCGIATGPFRFAVNRCAKNAPLTSIDVSSALQGAPVIELKEGGRDVEEYLGAGAAEDLVAKGNDFCASVIDAVNQLLPGEAADQAPVPAPSGGLFSKRRGRHAGQKRGRRS